MRMRFNRNIYLLIDTRGSGADAVKSVHRSLRHAERARIDYINDTYPREDVNRAALSRALIVQTARIKPAVTD